MKEEESKKKNYLEIARYSHAVIETLHSERDETVMHGSGIQPWTCAGVKAATCWFIMRLWMQVCLGHL